MLDDFINEQNIVYKTLINTVKQKKESHAYIIESNGYHKAFDIALAFAKYLLCPHNYCNKNNCNNCHQCENIDKNEFIELKIVEPEGQWIKKSQLEELQEMFSKKSIIGNKKIYIINKADKLNVSSSNSILKFLEEPEEGIIAILVVDSTSQLLETIISRCQILKLKKLNNKNNLSTIEKIANYLKDNDEDIKNFILNEDSNEKLIRVIEFIKYYESNKALTLLYINKLWNDIFKEREEISNAFSILELFYKDILNLKLKRNVEIFNENINDLKEIETNNSLNQLINKITVITNLKEKIKFNINSNMLMDKLIIELEGCD